jgi:hypothetical protein
MTRNGKIARLPATIREQINHRIENGHSGRDIVVWLNSLDEVKTALTPHFDNLEITDGNFSEWKLGGYRDWEARQWALAESQRVVEEAKEISEAGQGALADHLATWMLGQLVLATRRIMEKTEAGDTEGAWKLAHELGSELVRLRRGDQNAQRLRLSQERMQLQRMKFENQREKLKEEIRKENPPTPILSDEEKDRQWRQIFGINPENYPMREKWNDPPVQEEPIPAAPEVPTPAPETPITPAPPPEVSATTPERQEFLVIKKRAEQGDAYSQYRLGARYQDGFGTEKDLNEAEIWLEKAGSQGIGAAKITLHALRMRWDRESAAA